MNLNNLKPAWQQFKLLNLMQSLERDEILLIIERAEAMSMSKTHRYFINAIMFSVFVIVCQGG
jgi:hypothetical protein